MKWYLVIGGVFLIVALGAVVIVWVYYQDLQRTFDAYVPNTPQTEILNEEKDFTSENPEAGTEVDEQVTEPIVVDTTSLSETQQTILKTFGHDSQTLTITPAMVDCAENAVGKERLDAITSGEAPTPFEAAKILPCFKKD